MSDIGVPVFCYNLIWSKEEGYTTEEEMKKKVRLEMKQQGQGESVVEREGE